MRAIEMTDRQAVADLGPGGFAHQAQGQAFVGGKAFFHRRNQWGAIETWHVAKSDMQRDVLAHCSIHAANRGLRQVAPAGEGRPSDALYQDIEDVSRVPI
ncbi:hypothetical protein RvVAR0630_32050 [Agrobacterium vitis]|nr:hypothetical protein RvVAR0630_32050 [Agrobacterium vitis]